jgi:hypothetical protein
VPELLRAVAAGEKKRNKPTNVSVLAFPLALAARGHLREAAGTGTTMPLVLSQLALLGAIPPDSAARLAKGWAGMPGQGALFAAPMFAAHRDTAGLGSLVHRLDSLRQKPLPPQAPPIVRDVLSYLAAASRAYLTLARGDSAAALRAFDALPDSACFGSCPIDEIVHAQLLAARGRVADAAARLERPQVGFTILLPTDVLRALELGRLHERLGNRDRAIASYSFVLQAWRTADPELKPYVDEARAGIARLGGEQAKSGS